MADRYREGKFPRCRSFYICTMNKRDIDKLVDQVMCESDDIDKLVESIADALGVKFVRGVVSNGIRIYHLNGFLFTLSDGKLVYYVRRSAMVNFGVDSRSSSLSSGSFDLGDPAFLDNLGEFFDVLKNPGDLTQ